MLNKKYAKYIDKQFIKENQRKYAIGGGVVLILIIWIFSMLFGGGEVTDNMPTFKAKKGPLRISVTESGTIQPKEKLIVKNEVEGNTSIIYIVDEGTKVKKGDLLVELDSSNLQDQKINQEIQVQNAEASFISARENLAVSQNQAKSDVDKAQLTYDFAKEDLKKYQEGEYPNQLKEAESKITLAKEEFTRAKDTLNWSTKLNSEKYLSQSELQADELAEKQKELSLKLAENELELLQNFTHTRQVKQLTSDVEQAEMALERTQRKAKSDVVQAEATLKAREAEYNQQKDKLKKIVTQISKTKIYAPADGLALYATSTERRGRFGPSTEPLAEGSSVRERQELITLPTTTGFMAEISIYEASLDKVRPGLPVLIKVEALPGQIFQGKVSYVAPVPDAETSFMSPDIKVYDTKIEIQNSKNIDLLKSGMSCSAEIIVAQYDDAVYVPVQSVMRVNGKPTVYIVDGNDMEPRTVETGLDNNQMISINKGLKEGEVVSLTPPLRQATIAETGNEILDNITIPPPDQSNKEKVASSDAQVQEKRSPSQGGNQSSRGLGGPMGNAGGNMPRFSKEDIIKRMDQDGDGKLSKSEFRMGADRFDQMDKNKDGFITADEFEMPSFGGNGQGGFNGRMPSKDEIFKMSDRDGDGKISESEFRFGADRFKQMDKNGDGFITPDEFEMPSFSGRGGQGGFGGQSGGRTGGGGFNGFPAGGPR